MRGILLGAMLSALIDCGLAIAFDCVYSYSSGAINSAYFISGGGWHSLSVYYDDLVGKDFISYRRILGDGHPVSLDFVFNVVMEKRHPLDYAAVLSSSVGLHLVASSVDQVKAVTLSGFSSKEDLKSALWASASIPVVAGPPVVRHGERFVDGAVLLAHPFLAAEADGCTHVLVVRTRSANSSAGRLTPGKRLMAYRLERMQPGMGGAAVATIADYNRVAAHVQDLSSSGSGPPYVLDVACPAGSHHVGTVTPNRLALFQGMRAAYAAMRESFTGEHAEILLRPFPSGGLA